MPRRPSHVPAVSRSLAPHALLVALLALSCLDVGSPVPPGYEAVDVGRLLGCGDKRTCWSRATDVNERGVVVGDGLQASGALAVYAVEGEQRTVLWTRRYGGTDYPLALNDAGTVVGMALRDEPPVVPYDIGVRWENGVVTPLGVWPSDVNGAGDVAGTEGYRGAALWQGDTLVRLGTLADPDSEPRQRVSGALGINDGGVVVGWSETADFTTRAFVWQSGVMTELPTLGGSAFAADVNAAGQIVGWSVAPDGRSHAVLWEGGAITDLGTLGGDESYANGINDRGDVVGGARTAAGDFHAALWRGGDVIDLGTLPGYAASHAYRINESGVIVGYSAFPTALRATVWVPR